MFLRFSKGGGLDLRDGGIDEVAEISSPKIPTLAQTAGMGTRGWTSTGTS
jgi:hypothetical protein